jgi:transformation/transcription domain-associated protein
MPSKKVYNIVGSTTLTPRLFTIDLGILEHKVFFTELISLCEADDQSLQKLPCYKSITNLVSIS